MDKTHFLRLDDRKEILELVTSALQKAITELRNRIDQIDWYDGGWFVEEVEPILGLTYIAYQNYINSSIYDKYGSTADKLYHYKKGSKTIKHKRTEIELIVAIANYYKHRDSEGALHKGTYEVLKDLNLDYAEKKYPEELPILRATNILSDSWDLNDITKIVTDWRNLLWSND